VTGPSGSPLVIRLFNDHNPRSLLWFVEPVPPAAIALSTGLCRDLDAWAAYFAERMTDSGWAPDADTAWYEREGESLARRLASELGRGIAVDYLPVGSDAPQRFTDDAEPSRPEAAAAVRAIAARHTRAAESVADSAGGWLAHAPRSREIFRPEP